MLIKVTKAPQSESLQVVPLESVEFSDVVQTLLNRPDSESQIEELVRSNIQVIFGQDNTAMIVGQQVYNVNNKRCDLVALDDSGALVLIELKRSKDAMSSRDEPLEHQAIRYAASAATVKTSEALVQQMFERYVEKHRVEFESDVTKSLTNAELARRKLDDFLNSNPRARASFNKQQRIYLVAPAFTSEVLSASAWLVKSGVDLHCVNISATTSDKEYFLDFNEIIPPKSLDSYFVSLRSPVEHSRPLRSESTISTGDTLDNGVRWKELFENGAVVPGDRLILDTSDGVVEATLIDLTGRVEYAGKSMGATAWGKMVKRWSSINIYDQAFIRHEQESPCALKTLRQRVADTIARDNESVQLSDEDALASGIVETSEESAIDTNDLPAPELQSYTV